MFTDSRFSTAAKRYVTGAVTCFYTFRNRRARRMEKRKHENVGKQML